MSELTPHSLLAVLERYQKADKYYVALSGGLDSSVLLHALALLRDKLSPSSIHALHVDHGLHVDSSSWAKHCTELCQHYEIDLHILKADISLQQGDSIEEAARQARYKLLAGFISENDVLLTAQHQNDQAETFLLQALRGAGPKGLASMPESKPFSTGRHIRPLLAHSRNQLAVYASRNKLNWIEDPSNQNLDLRRNVLRQKILPQLEKSWPGLSATISRSAKHCAEANALLDDLAKLDLQNVRSSKETLSRSKVNSLDLNRRANVIRYWLIAKQLSLPNERRINTLIEQLQHSAEDKQLCISWAGGEIRTYRDHIFAFKSLPGFIENQRCSWHLSKTLSLDGGQLSATKSLVTDGVFLPEHVDEVEIRFRQGGERCRPVGQDCTRELKTLFQEWAVPPWVRNRIPLLYVEDQIAAVVGFCNCLPFDVRNEERAWQIHWFSPSISPFISRAN